MFRFIIIIITIQINYPLEKKMNKQYILTEKFNKTELSKIKSIIKKELKALRKNDLKKKDFEEFIKKEIKKSIDKLTLKDLDDKFDKHAEDIFKNLMQKYHEMFYRNKHIMNKLSL